LQLRKISSRVKWNEVEVAEEEGEGRGGGKRGLEVDKEEEKEEDEKGKRHFHRSSNDVSACSFNLCDNVLKFALVYLLS
jgi:hypothetical protein